MSIWTSDQLQRFALVGERSFARDYKCVVDRISLDIVSGTADYVLDEAVLDIRRVTYRGIKLEPLSHRKMRFYLDGPAPSGKPTHYIYDNVGASTIKLFPTPNETIVGVSYGLIEPSIIAAHCIVEYYAIPDAIKLRIPQPFRRRLLKAFVLKMAFSIEGKGQNLKAAKYWESKWQYLKETYGFAMEDLIKLPRKLVASDTKTDSPFGHATPVLPSNMRGVGVDPGE